MKSIIIDGIEKELLNHKFEAKDARGMILFGKWLRIIHITELIMGDGYTYSFLRHISDADDHDDLPIELARTEPLPDQWVVRYPNGHTWVGSVTITPVTDCEQEANPSGSMGNIQRGRFRPMNDDFTLVEYDGITYSLARRPKARAVLMQLWNRKAFDKKSAIHKDELGTEKPSSVFSSSSKPKKGTSDFIITGKECEELYKKAVMSHGNGLFSLRV